MTETLIDERQAAKWAQEETLRRLLKEAAVSNQILEKYVESKLSKDELEALKKNVDATKDVSTSTTTGLRDLGNRYDKTLKEAYRDLDKSLSSSFRDFAMSMRDLSRDGILGVLQNSSEKASKNLFSMGQNLTGFGSKLSYAGAGLATFATLLMQGWDIVSDLNDNYLRLYENGINFTQGLRGMTQATGDLGVTTEQLIGIFTQHGAAVASLGTDRAVRLGKEFVKLNRNMGELGLTNAQATEAVLEYTELIRSTGQLSKMSNRELVEGTREYYSELNQITAITGQNRKEIQKSIEARAKEASYQALLRSLPEDVQKNLTKSMATLEKLGPAGAQAAQKTIVAMLARGGVSGLDPALRQALNQTGLIGTFETLSQKAAAGADITDEMAEIAGKLGNPEVFKTFQAFADMPGPVGDMIRQLAEMAGSSQNLVEYEKSLAKEGEKRAAAEAEATGATLTRKMIDDQIAKVRKEREDAAEARNKLATETQNTLTQASETLTSVFNTLVVDVMQPLLPALRLFGDIVITLANGFKMLSDGIGGLLRMIPFYKAETNTTTDTEGNEITTRESDWTDTAGSLGALGAAGGVIAGGVYAKRRLFGGRRRGRATTGREEQEVGGVDLDTLGAGMEAIGRAGPTLGPGLTGAATGLKAFANPQIIVGAGILAGAITALGAGIAGATWIMGKSLPSLADGLKSFADIDGAKLGEVGTGMIKIGGGLIAMGVGEVASAWGSIASGITGLFQADPISKLMRFAEISAPLTQAADSMERFGQSYPNAIRMLNDVELGPQAINAMEQINKLLGADMGTFFGGEPPIIGQISALADSVGKLSQNANQLTMGGVTPETTTSDLTDSTLEFYDNTKTSYQSMIGLLRTVNEKLDKLDKTTQDQTTELTRSFGRNSNSVF